MCRLYLWLHCKQNTPCSWGSKRVKELQEKYEKHSNNENWKKSFFQRRKRCWMILLYAVKAPLHCRTGPSKPPLRLRAGFWMTATLNFEIVVHSVCCSSVTSCGVQSCANLGSTFPGRDQGSPVQSLPVAGSMEEAEMPLSFLSYPFSQTGWSQWLTPWPALKPQKHPGADTGMMRGHLWDAISGATTGPNATSTQAPSRPISGSGQTDSVLRAPTATIPTHLKSVGSDGFLSLPHPGESGSPWCLSWKSQ